MSIKMLIFDFRESEKQFFEDNKFENFDITFFKESLDEETVEKLTQKQLEQTTVISIFINSKVTQSVINRFKNLRILSTRSTGIDHIDHKACVNKNIDVINVGSYGARSVAQYTVGLMIALIRKIVPASQYIINKDRTCESFIGRDISKLTIGVVGTGSIGGAVCKLTSAMGMNVLAYDLVKRQELLSEVEYVDFDTLIKNSDVISLHLPYTGTNRHMISAKQFKMMKSNAYLINTSRGEILDAEALYYALLEKEIAGAGLDVVSCETYSFKCNRFSHILGEDLACAKEAETVLKLAEFPNVIITPHIAYETQDAINYLLEMTFKGIVDCIQGGSQFKNL
jgi:D-lactate dehydrogenase